MSPWQRSTRLRNVQPVKGTSRLRQGRMFGSRFLRLCRKLQHGRALAFAKMRQQHDLAVGKLQRIMVRAGVVHVHLPEPCDPVRQRFGPPEQKLEAGEMTRPTSVPGRRQTATLGSSSAEKPSEVVFQNYVVTSLSPTLAGLVATPCRL